MGHLPSHPLPLGGKREGQEAPAFASCPGRKGEAETPAGAALLPRKGVGSCSQKLLPPAPGEGELGAG